MSHIVDAHVAYIKAIADLSRDKVELLERIKRLEEAGDKIVEAGWSVQDWSGMCVVWAKAKEDKLSVNPIQLLGANLIKAGIGFTTEDKP